MREHLPPRCRDNDYFSLVTVSYWAKPCLPCQLSTNLGWLTLDLPPFTEVYYCVYTIKNFTSVKLKQNQGKHLSWKHELYYFTYLCLSDLKKQSIEYD